MPRGKSPHALDLPRPTSWLDKAGVNKQDGAYEALRSAILTKMLPAGSRLPSSRTLAERWELSRGTIETVFDRLHAEAYVTRVPGSGTRVCAVVPERFLMAGFADATPAGTFSAPIPVSDTGVRDGLPFVARRADASLFPMAAWSKCATRALAAATPEQLCSADPAGLPQLRQQIADFLAKYRGIRCDPQDIVVTTGIRHAIDLLARSIVRDGDKVCLEEPGYPAARALFALAGAVPVDIAVDAEGIDCAALAAHADASLAYVTPSHQMPLGVSMSLPRRLALLAWAAHNKAWLVEDDYDSEYRYTGAPLASLQSLDRAGCVVYVGTLSKVLFPGLRLGYMVAPPALADALVQAKAVMDRHTAIVPQMALADFIAEGHFGRHIRRTRDSNAERRDLLVRGIARELGDQLACGPADSGLELCAYFRAGHDEETVARAGLEHGIELRPLGHYADPAAGPECATPRGLLLGFAAIPPAEMAHGLQELGRILRGR
ncbi:HTH-type transcriptional regulatory protein GabR [Janthinobacterium sp. MP5059B]|uniref:MocR-like pyridoxine biosynthesis transcription factor PdxR n=1 Tax=Janthinobacterium sp. MP5059B TaxID=1766683 RepID=UPI000875359A|nr:PLP-dependent aminotransferase family protein [Janthinobacterium sp. MP5059B]OEZ45759.1 HTH-type transcriptional regulatory protein GabR [Janthinobacterium sp. MP5059B]